jgi:hypothetical protein
MKKPQLTGPCAAEDRQADGGVGQAGGQLPLDE